jgi:hypothetical protein
LKSRSECFLKEYRPCDLAGSPWSTSFVSWIYNYLCNHYLSPLKVYPMQHNVIKFVSDFVFLFFLFFFVIFIFYRQWLAADQWSSPRTPVSFTWKYISCYSLEAPTVTFQSLALSIPDDGYSNKIPWAPNKTFIIEDYLFRSHINFSQ